MTKTTGYSKPSEYASNEEKLSPKYGKQYATNLILKHHPY